MYEPLRLREFRRLPPLCLPLCAVLSRSFVGIGVEQIGGRLQRTAHALARAVDTAALTHTPERRCIRTTPHNRDRERMQQMQSPRT